MARHFALPGLLAALVLASASLNAAPASAAEDGEVILYVHEFDVDKRLGGKGTGVTGTLCNRLVKDKRLDVICESDAKALMQLNNLQSMMGSSAEDSSPLARRMGDVDVIVSGRVTKGKYGLILDVQVAERDPAFEGEVLQAKREHGRIRIKGIKDGLEGVSDRLGRLSKRVAALAVNGPREKEPAQ